MNTDAVPPVFLEGFYICRKTDAICEISSAHLRTSQILGELVRFFGASPDTGGRHGK